MRKLTDKERKMVEENEKLIYWYCNKKGIPLDEWYGLLAIELCKTVRKYNPDRGALSSYFKMRADLIVYREGVKKYRSLEIEDYEIDDEVHSYDDEDNYYKVMLEDLIEDDLEREIIRLKIKGYTQSEIGEMLGYSQSYISLILKEMRDKLESYR